LSQPAMPPAPSVRIAISAIREFFTNRKIS
jgi:hypothetical protein